MAKKQRKRFLPDLPAQPLAVPIVDNHTHIYPDPQPATAEIGAESPAAHFESTPAKPLQNRDSQGRLLMPVLEETLLAGMAQAGVRAAITSGCELPEFAHTLQLAQRVPNIWAAIALHPNEAAMHAQISEKAPDGLTHELQPHHLAYDLDAAIAQVAQLVHNPAVQAVGETGLDYFRTADAGKDAQKAAFRAHIQLAKETDKPLQIHDREAHADVVEILLRDGAPARTVFHCFSGDTQLAEICRENGWYASFAGPLTYPVNTHLQAAFTALPDELILVETDAPYLTPAPYRGQPNAVWGCVYTAQYMAQLRGVPLEEWCAKLNENTFTVYQI